MKKICLVLICLLCLFTLSGIVSADEPTPAPTGMYDGKIYVYCNVDGAEVTYEYYKPGSSKIYNKTKIISDGKVEIRIAGSVDRVKSINVSADGYQPQYNVNFTPPNNGKSTSVTVNLEPLPPKSPMPIISLFGGFCTAFCLIVRKINLKNTSSDAGDKQ